jgi:aldose sugar dehydrogenase
MKHIVFLLLLFAIISCKANPGEKDSDRFTSSELKIKVELLAENLQNPWSMAFLPDGRILIAERPGRLRIFENGKLNPEPIAGLPPVWANGQGGLLDVVLHPDYETNGWIYLAYARRGQQGGNTAISRVKLTGNQLIEEELLFHGEPSTNAGQHFGSRILFDGDNFLYFTIGDRGEMDNAQNLGNHNGKIMRLRDDGSVPHDNPFVNRAGAKPEIWNYGHRNIQGMAWHPITGELWTHEHGPRGGDEINIELKGENYGWPKVTHGINYNGTQITPHTSLPGMIDPIHQWTPSIAPCGMCFVTSSKYPQWENNLLVGALAGQHIQRLVFDGHNVVHTERLLEGRARFRDIRQGPDGFIYVLTEGPGQFFRLVPD